MKEITGEWLLEQFSDISSDWITDLFSIGADELAHRINQLFNEQPTREMVGWTYATLEELLSGNYLTIPISGNKTPYYNKQINLTIYPDEVRIKEVKE